MPGWDRTTTSQPTARIGSLGTRDGSRRLKDWEKEPRGATTMNSWHRPGTGADLTEAIAVRW